VGATRAVARVVLLEDGFAALPDLLREGRRVIANIERSANLFVTKAGYVMLLTLAISVAGTPFPLLPRQITLAGSLSVGIPGFLLALAPNAARASSGFLPRVLRFAAPASCIGTAASLATYAATRLMHGGDLALGRTAAVLTLTGCGLSLLPLLTGPSGWLRRLLALAMALGMLVVMLLPEARAFFGLRWLPVDVWVTVAVVLGVASLGLARLLGSPVALKAVAEPTLQHRPHRADR
jgi:cation-transporting ATPase E